MGGTVHHVIVCSAVRMIPHKFCIILPSIPSPCQVGTKALFLAVSSIPRPSRSDQKCLRVSGFRFDSIPDSLLRRECDSFALQQCAILVSNEKKKYSDWTNCEEKTHMRDRSTMTATKYRTTIGVDVWVERSTDES